MWHLILWSRLVRTLGTNFHHRYLAMGTISTSFSPTLHVRFAGSLSFFVTQALIGWVWLTCPSHTCSGNYKGKYLAFGFYGGRRLPSFTKWEFLEYKKGILLLFSCVWLFATPWTAAHQASLSFTISQSLLKLMSIESVMPSNHLILCHPLFLLPSIFPSIRVFSNESALRIRWAKYWSFSISPSNEYSALISFRIDWFFLLAVQGSLKSSPAPQFRSITSSVLSLLYGSTLTSVHDYWKNHSLD